MPTWRAIPHFRFIDNLFRLKPFGRNRRRGNGLWGAVATPSEEQPMSPDPQGQPASGTTGPGVGPSAGSGGTPKRVVRPRSAGEIQDWMVSYLARILQRPAEEIDVSAPFEQFAIDSAQAIGMTGDLDEWLAIRIDPMVVYDYPTIESLAEHLAGRTVAKAS